MSWIAWKVCSFELIILGGGNWVKYDPRVTTQHRSHAEMELGQMRQLGHYTQLSYHHDIRCALPSQPNGNCWPISLFAREMLMEILDPGWWSTLRTRRANQFKTWALKLQWGSRWHQWTMKSRLFGDSRQDWRLKICKFQSDQIHVSMAPNYAALILVWCFQISLSQCRDCPNLWSAWVQARPTRY